MAARVADNGAVSETLTNGVKQGCVLAPTFFRPTFSVMLLDAYRIRVAYRTVDQLLSHRRMHLQSRDQQLPSNDCALNATTDGDMQSCEAIFRRRLWHLWPNHQHGEGDVYTPTATHCCLHCTPHQRELSPTASRADFHLSRQRTPSEHQNRRRSGPSNLQGQPSLRAPAKHRLDLSRSPPQHQTRDYKAVIPETMPHGTETWTVYET
ncbi:hypothetical protein SprV_0100184900 [Sparganum proliferum]